MRLAVALTIVALAVGQIAAVQMANADDERSAPLTYEQARNAASKTPGFRNLQKLGLALHGYHDVFGRFPSAVNKDPDTGNEYSWRVELLPILHHYVEGNNPTVLRAKMDRRLYVELIKNRGYETAKKWNSKANLKFFENMPAVYRHPSDKPDSSSSAFYAVTGFGTVFEADRSISYDDITAWPASTVMLVTMKHREVWTKPVDVLYSEDAIVPRFGGFDPNGALVLTADGAVHFLHESTPVSSVRALLTVTTDDSFVVPGVPFRY